MAFLRVLCVFFVLVHVSSGRAVNISNTWVLPEEGFPVFYRYFRDRISWYEADAVCQFHHSYLVTADSTSQYDAIRAYLKELDITDNVWIGLSRNAEKPSFTWTNSLQELSGEGHWQESIPKSKNPLCVAMDPAKDFLWKTFTCGGPEVASFICETPIPSWAVGPKGCLLTELPSLTVLYIPERSSLELTSDCGLDGTKRIACKGNADREEILKQLTCAMSNEDFEDKTTKSGITSPTASYAQNDGKTTKTAIWTSNTIDVDYGMPTRHRRETEDTLSASSTESTGKVTSTLETFAATNYDTEVTANSARDFSTMEPIAFNASDSSDLEIVLDIQKSEFTDNPATTITSHAAGTISEKVSPVLDKIETSTSVTSSPSSTASTLIYHILSSTVNPVEKEVPMEYPSAINQGQLFSIIENGTMFDIIELNDTAEPKILQEISHSEDKQKLKPSTKLDQLDDKNIKLPVDPKSKPQSKKDIYKNSDPKKKKAQTKSEEKNKEKLIVEKEGNTEKSQVKDEREKEGINNKTEPKNITELLKNNLKEVKEKTTEEAQIEANTTPASGNKEKREEKKLTKEEPEDKTEKIIEKESTKEETDLKSQVEMFPIKQIEGENIDKTDDDQIYGKEENIESTSINKDVETFTVKQVKKPNNTPIRIDYDIDKKEEQAEKQRRVDTLQDQYLNKEVEFFPVINNKAQHLNRTFRKELPMLADEPFDESKEVDENKLELMDTEEIVRKPFENETKIDPNIDLLNKNITKNNDSEIIGHIGEDVLKKQLLPKSLQGDEQKSTVKQETTTEQTLETEEGGDHPKPNRQRLLTRPHGRPFYPNFFSRVLG